jgi:hypothetical protein
MSESVNESATAPSSGARRFTGVTTTRVQAGAGYDEWFELSESLSTGDMMAVRRKAAAYMRAHPEADEEERREVMGAETFAAMIRAWSFCDASGAPLPITRDTVMALPANVILPAFKLFQERQAERESFLDPSTTTSLKN